MNTPRDITPKSSDKIRRRATPQIQHARSHLAFHVRSCRASLPAPSMAGLSGGLSGKRPTQRDHPRHPARDSTRPNPFSCKRRTRRGTPGRVTRSSRRPPYVKIFDSCSMHLVHRLVGDPRGRTAGSRHAHLGWKHRSRCSATQTTMMFDCCFNAPPGHVERQRSRTSQKAFANVSCCRAPLRPGYR